MKLVKLDFYLGGKQTGYFNAEQIVLIRDNPNKHHGWGSRIYLTDDSYWEIYQTPDEIYKLISK